METEQTVELKWLILNKLNKGFHSSRVKFPKVKMSASWFLVSMYLIWILESRSIRSNNQSNATLWVLETCLIVGLLPFLIILITASSSSSTYNKFLDAQIGHLKEQNQCLSLHRSSFETNDVCEHHYQVAPIYLEHEKHFRESKQFDPIFPEQANHLISVQCPRKCFQILLNCANLKFVSYTYN